MRATARLFAERVEMERELDVCITLRHCIQSCIDREVPFDASACPMPPHELLSQVQNKIDLLQRLLATA